MRYGCPSPVCQAKEKKTEENKKRGKKANVEETKENKVTRLLTKLKANESQAIFFKPRPEDRDMMATKKRIETQRGAFMKWENEEFTYCPELESLAWEIETAEGWEDRPLVSIIKSGMATGKSYAMAVRAVDGFVRWVCANIEVYPSSSPEHRQSRWYKLLADLTDDETSLIDKLYLLKSPKIIGILPREICIMNIQRASNELIGNRVRAILDEEDNACPVEISKRLADAICSVIFFQHYIHDITQADIATCNVARVMLCVPSLCRFKDLDFDMVMMDESERDLLLLTESSLMKTPRRMLECARALEQFIRTATSEQNEHAAGVYLMDADISARTLEFACNMVSPDRVIVFNNLRENKKLQHTFLIYSEGNKNDTKRQKDMVVEPMLHSWYRALQSSLLEGKNVWCVTGSKEEGHRIENLVVGEEWVPAEKVLFINSMSDHAKKQMLKDLNVLTKYQLVIVTPVITVGSDFTPEHFDVCFAMCTAYSIDFEQIYQTIGRVRNLKDQHVALYVGRNCLERALPTTLDGVKAWFNSRRDATKWVESMVLEKNKPIESIMHDETVKDWLRSVYFQNKLHENMSRADYTATMKHHLRDKKCFYIEKRFNQVSKDDHMEMKGLLKSYKTNPEEIVYEDESIDFLEGPDYLNFEKEVQKSGILERKSKLTEWEKGVLEEFEAKKKEKRRIEEILVKDEKRLQMTEKENYIAAVVKYLRKIEYAERGNKPCYTMYRNYTKGFNKRKVDRLMAIDNGIGPQDVLNDCQREVSQPGQELMGCSEAARMTAMEHLLRNFNRVMPSNLRNDTNHFLGVKDLRTVDVENIVIDSSDFSGLIDRKPFLKVVENTATLLGARGDPDPEAGWQKVKRVLDRVLDIFGAYVLIPVCREKECKGYFEKENKCEDHERHSKKVSRRPCDCEAYKAKQKCRCRIRSNLYRIVRTEEGDDIAETYFSSKKRRRE